MAKLPKLSDFTDVSALMTKFKSAFDNLGGPGGTAASEEALARESDPTKAKLLEIELLIKKLHDMMVLQIQTINELDAKYAEVKNLAIAALVPTEEAATKPAAPQPETPPTEKPKEDE